MPTDHYLGDGPNPAADLALGEGRNIDTLTGAADTQVTLAQNVEGGKVGETVSVAAERAAWLIANGLAIQPERFTDQYADAHRPAPEDPEPETEPEPDPEPDPEPTP